MKNLKYEKFMDLMMNLKPTKDTYLLKKVIKEEQNWKYIGFKNMSFILYINWITQFLPGVQLGKIYLTSNFFDIGFIKGWNMLWLKITSGAIFG